MVVLRQADCADAETNDVTSQVSQSTPQEAQSHDSKHYIAVLYNFKNYE